MPKEAAETKLSRFLLLQLAGFRFLTHLRIEKTFGVNNEAICEVEMKFSEEFSSGNRQLRLKFMDAVEMRFDDLNETGGSLVAVRNIADRGLENIVYRLTDGGSGSFSLNCRDFEYEVLEHGLSNPTP